MQVKEKGDLLLRDGIERAQLTSRQSQEQGGSDNTGPIVFLFYPLHIYIDVTILLKEKSGDCEEKEGKG